MDIATYTLVPYNLEIMKLSAYYKKKREIVVLSPSFTPERHQKFFLRKDYDDGNFPLELNVTKNLEYGGHAFSGEKYIPLSMSTIENNVMTMKFDLGKKKLANKLYLNVNINDESYKIELIKK